MGKIIIIIQIRFKFIIVYSGDNVSRQRPETYKPLAKNSRPLIKKYKPLVNVSRPDNMPRCHLWCDYRCDLTSKNSY